jgi:tetratricopeptide (TPR) repeat protein
MRYVHFFPAILSAIVFANTANSEVPDACKADSRRIIASEKIAQCESVVAKTGFNAKDKARILVDLGYSYQLLDLMGRKPRANERAEAAWNKAILADRTNPDAYVAIARLFRLDGRGSLALPVLEAALAVDSGYWPIHDEFSQFYMSENDLHNARKSAAKSVSLCPDCALAQKRLGAIHMLLNNDEAAVKNLKLAVEKFDPAQFQASGIIGEETPHSLYAQALARIGKPEEAAQVLTDWIQKQPSQMVPQRLWVERAEHYEVAKKYDLAADDWAKAALIPGVEKPDALLARKAFALAQIGKGKSAISDVLQILDRAEINTVLRIQVFLKNNGFDAVRIDGKVSPELRATITECLRQINCRSGFQKKI